MWYKFRLKYKNKLNMKIVVKIDEQHPEITIDLNRVYYSYAIKDAIVLALQLNGYTKETIAEVFNLYNEYDKII